MISYSRIYRASGAELIPQKKTRIISAILFGFAGLIYGCDTTSRGSGTDPSALGIFIYLVSLYPLFSCCISVFKDMRDVPAADVSMSMPLNGTERYFSKVLTVVRVWFVPFFISAGAAFMLSAVFGGSHYSVGYGDLSDYSRTYHPEVMMISNLKMILWFLAAALFVTAVTFLCQCCVGAKAESRYLPIMMMIVLSVFTPAVSSFITDRFAQVTLSSYDFFLDSFWTFSGLLLHLDSTKSVLLIAANCIISAGVIFAGAFICRKRDARSVGRPIVFPLFFELIMAVTLWLFFLLFHAGSGSSLVAMFLAWLGSIILRIVVSRKKFTISKVGDWTGLFAVYYFIFLIFMYIAFLTSGFGAIAKTPALSEYDALSDGASANVTVSIDKMENSYDRNGYYSSVTEVEDLRFSADISKKQQLTEFVDSVSDAAVKQSRIKGLFANRMFGSKMPAGVYRCDIRISLDSENEYYRTVYNTEFYSNESTAQSLINQAEKLSGQNI